MKTNIERAAWARRYGQALRNHVERGPAAGLKPALRLGRRAAALGLETLDLAGIHTQAMATMPSPTRPSRTKRGTIARAKEFFAETVVPIELAHRAALQAGVRFDRLTKALRRRTVESSASARHLKRGIARRQVAEAALKKSGKHRAGLLQKSRRLQHRLRCQAHTILSAQETERQKISLQLHDEIAQTLLGIDIRLLALKKTAKSKTEHLKKEIASTQRLVGKSSRTICRLAHELGVYDET